MSTDIIRQVQSTHVLNTTIIGVWATIWTTYICAVLTGAVPPPFSTGSFQWPMISDTWAVVPGNYISRFCMPPFIMTWALFCWSVSDWLDTVCWNQRYLMKLQNRAMRYLIQIGCIGFLACVAVGEDEFDPIHSTGALTFFVSQGLFCSNIVLQMGIHPHTAHNAVSFIFKLFINVLYWCILILFAILSQDWHHNTVAIAVCEWMAVWLVTMFHLSLRWELKNVISFAICKKSTYLTI